MRYALLLLIVIGMASSTHQGFVGYAGCMGYCWAKGPARMADLLDLYVGNRSCSGICILILATGLSIPALCFDQDSVVTRVLPGSGEEQVRVADLRSGDYVLTSHWKTGEAFATLVTDVQRIEGEHSFVGVRLGDRGAPEAAGQYLEVTESHVMMVLEGEFFETRPAREVRPGDLMMTHSGVRPVVSTDRLNRQVRVQLTTEAGSVLANGVLTTSHCEGRDATELFTN